MTSVPSLLNKPIRFTEIRDVHDLPSSDDSVLIADATVLSDTTRNGFRVLVITPVAIHIGKGERTFSGHSGFIYPLPEHTATVQFPTLVEQESGIWKMLAEDSRETRTYLGTLEIMS